jgi:L-ascorbate metabolism protein UlaG (beta-lactamase superfamily)
MKILWYGHSAFQVVTEDGVRIIIDPYESGAFGGSVGYGKIKDEADIVLISHNHEDHNCTKDIQGKFTHINKAGQYKEKGVEINAMLTFHDKTQGKERGTNLVFVISAEDMRVAHLGDLGHIPDGDVLEHMGKIDVLLLPVGGFFTIDAKEATEIMNMLKPAITIPMHYKTEKADFPIENLSAFIGNKKNVKELKTSDLTVTKATLPAISEIIVLRHAL